ncbi:calcium-transporting atpase 12 [Quercus suber]|uniref:Calcium-transporting atpase 12 n=1 Tax=Quercus suber TaxID=58331 RepID=A0AAW0KET9_QUESU
MAKEKDLNSIQKFGGIEGIAEALGSDLEKGIPGHEQDLLSHRIAHTLSTTETTALDYFQFLAKSCNNYTILLLFVSAVLSLGFGIKEEGMKTGWYEGVIIILVAFIIVVVDSLPCTFTKDIRKAETPLGMQRMMVDVVRGGCFKQIFICDVLIGDIVHLKRDHIVPADGLFISNNGFLKMDDDSESIIDDKNAFHFYGAKVTDGTCRMLVASVGMDTTWDNVSVLETMHLECGLVPKLNRSVLKGEDFPNYSHEERMYKVDKIFLMERSLPSDKLLLMQYLKKKGHLLAMVGVKTNEIPALKEAKLRIATTFSNEMVIESSDIVIRDGSFSSFVTSVSWAIDNSITTMFCGSSPITTIQLLWTNCIVALFGGLGLLTEPPTEKLMERLQFKPSELLITKAMWRNLLIQALYQAAILMTFQFRGQTILGVSKKCGLSVFEVYFKS